MDDEEDAIEKIKKMNTKTPAAIGNMWDKIARFACFLTSSFVEDRKTIIGNKNGANKMLK